MDKKLPIQPNLLETIDNIITMGKVEASYPQNSLNRIALSASRLGDDQKARLIEEFLVAVKDEIAFFRNVSERESGLELVGDTAKNKVSLGKAYKLLGQSWTRMRDASLTVMDMLSSKSHHLQGFKPHKLFTTVEGFAYAGDPRTYQLSGPFLAVAAANFAHQTVFGPEIRVYLFTQGDASNRSAQSTSDFELRVMSAETFESNIAGRSMADVTIFDNVKPLVGGSIKDVFASAVKEITRFSLGYDAPRDVADRWTEHLKAYQENLMNSSALG